MNRTLLAAFATLAACSSDPAPTGPQTITIDKSQCQGMLTSSPAGLLCGSCTIAGGCGSNEPATGSDCSAEFEAGTSVTLSLTEQSVYFRYACSSPEDPAVTGCTFTVRKPMTVVVLGVAAVR